MRKEDLLGFYIGVDAKFASYSHEEQNVDSRLELFLKNIDDSSERVSGELVFLISSIFDRNSNFSHIFKTRLNGVELFKLDYPDKKKFHSDIDNMSLKYENIGRELTDRYYSTCLGKKDFNEFNTKYDKSKYPIIYPDDIIDLLNGLGSTVALKYRLYKM